MTDKHPRVRKAVLPVAGLGTRFLPATKAIPKEMLTVVDKPLIQYAVEECMAAGIESIIFVTGRRKAAIEDHFDFAPELEAFLKEKGKMEMAELVHNISGDAHFSYTRQREALGLGHAVLTARELVGNEPFAVLLGDVIMESKVAATKSLVEIFEQTGKGAITVQEVPREQIHFYGVVDPEPANEAKWGNSLLRVKGMVEKPKAEVAPSNLGVSGRYVLPPEIFGYLEHTKPGAGGEIQLTDGLQQLAKNEGLFAHVHDGKTHDAGDKMGFLKATVELALQDKKLSADFRRYLREQKF
jgi:UTP--glucose-1-phosphate uridylyltransferase